LTHELRWNPLLGSWIVVAGHRIKRPWRKGECPFCPGGPETGGEWTVLSIPNKYPSLSPDAPEVCSESYLFKKERAQGICEVIIETTSHEGDFHTIPLQNVMEYLKLLGERTVELAKYSFIRYVLPFKNKGKIIGVSLTHPHSQIYALPIIPYRVAREITMVKKFRKNHDLNLFEEIYQNEAKEGKRILYENELFMLLLPYYAMWPYELHIYPKKAFHLLSDLKKEDRRELAKAIMVATAVYSKMFGNEYSYIMMFHQAPVKGEYPDYWLHVEFYTPHLSRERLKYPAGIEWGGWIFTYDGVPEERLHELKSILNEEVDLSFL